MTSGAPGPRPRTWPARLIGPSVGLATLALMLATEPRLAIVWDEGYTLGREARVRLWFQALRDPAGFARGWTPPREELVQATGELPPRADRLGTRAGLFAPDVLRWFWPFGREEPHGHPPFYALVGLVGDLVAPGWATLPRARLGPIAVFSLTAGCLAGFLHRRFGPWAATAGAGAWALQPRLFAHGHYATYDALLTSLWVLAILAFWRAVEPGRDGARSRGRVGWAAVLGVLFGWAADTKLTGWFLPVPFLAWAAVARSRPALRVALMAAPVALATLYAFNPPWWPDPIDGVARFLRSNLGRGATIPISVRFLGTTYKTPIESLPPYNTLVWTVLVVPAGLLLLALVGLVRSVARARSEPFGPLVAGHWAFLMALRSLPHTPGHDGVRLFLPAFGVLAIAAGLGAGWAARRLGRAGGGLILVALIEGAASVLVMMPVPLSYYSPLVGGLPGAARLGMEPTYYWDALTDEALDFLNRETPPGRTVAFDGFSTSFLHLRQAGRLRTSFHFEPGERAFVVIQNRPGAMRLPPDPKGAVYIHRKFGVPLLWVLPIQAATPP